MNSNASRREATLPIIRSDFLTTNGLQLSFLGNGTYCFEGTNGSTPMCPIPWLGSPSADTNSTGNDTSNVEPAPNCVMVQSNTRGPVSVSVQDNICIPGRTESVVHGITPKSSKEQCGTITPKLDSALACSISAAYTVCWSESRNVPVRLMNTSNVDLQLHVGQTIGLFCPFSDGSISVACLFHLPYAYWNETKAQVEGMPQQGVIHPSSSPWASPIVLFTK